MGSDFCEKLHIRFAARNPSRILGCFHTATRSLTTPFVMISLTKITLSLCLYLLLISIGAAEQIATIKTRKGDGLRIRSSPLCRGFDDNHNVIGSKPNGSEVTILERGPVWSRILFFRDGHAVPAYTNTEFLVESVPSATTQPATKGATRTQKSASSAVDGASEMSSALAFYKSLAMAVSSADGHAFVDFHGGKFATSSGGSTLVWEIVDGTYAEINFHYKDGVLQSTPPTTVTFTPPIKVRPAGQSSAYQIWKLHYENGGGIVSDSESKPDGRGANDPSISPKMARHFELNTSASALFLGKPFKTSDKATYANEDGTISGPRISLISRVRFTKKDNSNPGLEVSLRDNQAIRLSKGQGQGVFDNYFRIMSPSGFNFQELSYDLDDGFVDGDLEQLRLNVIDGLVNSGDVLLSLQGGSKVQFDRIRFEREKNGNSRIDGEGGNISGRIGRGSRLSFSRGTANDSEFVVDDGSSIQLLEPRLTIDDRTGTTFQVGGGSTMTLNAFDGRFAFGDSSFVKLQSGKCEFLLNGSTWRTGKNPNVSGKILLMEINLSSGLFVLNPESKLSIAAGRIASSNLVFNSHSKPWLTGSFSEFNAQLKASEFGSPGGMHLTSSDGGELRAPDSNNPLTLLEGEDFPTGAIDLKLPIQKLVNHANSSFIVTGGTAFLGLRNSVGGVTASRPDSKCEFVGAELALDAGGAKLVAKVNITNGELSARRMLSTAKFKGLLSGTLLSLDLPIVTSAQGLRNGYDWDGKGGVNKDARMYPIRITASLKNQCRIEPSNLNFDGSQVEAAVGFAPQLNALVLEGGGEYNDKDNPEAGTNGGEYPRSQEVFRDTFGTSWVHFYLHPKRYSLSLNAALNYTTKGIGIDLYKVEIDPAITKDNGGWGIDGPSIPIISTVVAALLSQIPHPLFNGPGTAQALVIGGFVGGKAAEDHLEALVNTKIAEWIQERRSKWIPRE